MSRTWNKRRIFGLMAGICLLAVLAVAILYYRFPSKWAGRKVSQSLFQRTGWQLEIGEIRPTPLGSFSIGPVTLRGPSHQVMFELSRMVVDYDVTPLLHSVVHIRRLHIKGPKLHARIEGDRWNVLASMDLLPPSPEPFMERLGKSADWENVPFDQMWRAVETFIQKQMVGMPAVRIDDLAITGFTVDTDDGKGLRAELPGMDLKGSMKISSRETEGDLSAGLSGNRRLHAILPQTKGPALEYGADAEWTMNLAWKKDRSFSFHKEGALRNSEYPEVSGGVEMTGNLDQGSLTVSRMSLLIPGWLKVDGKGEIQNAKTFSGSLDAQFDVKSEPSPSLNQLLRLAGLNPPWPVVQMQGSVKGELNVRTIAEARALLNQKKLPLETTANLSLTARKLPSVGGTSLQNAQGSFSLEAHGSDAHLLSNLNIDGLRTKDPDGQPLGPLSVHHKGVVDLSEMKSLQISSLTLNIPELGLAASLSGKVQSLDPPNTWLPKDPKAPFPIKAFREQVTADVLASLIVNPKSGLPKGVTAKGEVDFKAHLKKSDAKSVMFSAAAKAKDFSFQKGSDLVISGMTFDLPFEKTLLLGPDASKGQAKASAVLWEKNFMSRLRSLSTLTNRIHIDQIHKGDVLIENLGADIGFDGRNLIVDGLTMNLLGGSVWGRFTLVPDRQQLRLSAALELTEIDAGKITRQPFEGDAQFSADASGHLAVLPQEKLSAEVLLDEIDAAVHLTKAGAEVLDRLIVAADPSGKNPSLVQARGLLKGDMAESALRNPTAAMHVSHGILNADINLSSVKGVKLSIPIRGISLKNMLNLKSVRQSLEGMLPALESTKMLDLAGIDDQGKLVFFQGTP